MIWAPETLCMLTLHCSALQTLVPRRWQMHLAQTFQSCLCQGKILKAKYKYQSLLLQRNIYSVILTEITLILAYRFILSFKFDFYLCRETMDVVKQSAALCLLRLFRTTQEIIPGGEWTSRIIHLLNDQHMGVVTAACSLIEALVKKNPDEYKGCVSLAVSRLSRVSI